MSTTWLDVYRSVFDRKYTSEEVKTNLEKVQEVARQYVADYNPNPLPITDTSLDAAINEVYGLSIAMTDAQRQAMVDLLVNYHNLQELKPWAVVGPSMSILVW